MPTGRARAITGPRPPARVRAVQAQAARGSTFLSLSEASIRLAGEVVRAAPCAERMRFVSSGTDFTLDVMADALCAMR